MGRRNNSGTPVARQFIDRDGSPSTARTTTVASRYTDRLSQPSLGQQRQLAQLGGAPRAGQSSTGTLKSAGSGAISWLQPEGGGGQQDDGWQQRGELAKAALRAARVQRMGGGVQGSAVALCGSYVDHRKHAFVVRQEEGGCTVKFEYEGIASTGTLSGQVLFVEGWPSAGVVDNEGNVEFQDGGWWTKAMAMDAPAARELTPPVELNPPSQPAATHRESHKHKHVETKAPSILDSKLLWAMGVLPGDGRPPMEDDEMFDAIEAFVDKILYDPNEPKEKKHFTATESWVMALIAFQGRVKILQSPVWWAIALTNITIFLVFEWYGAEAESADPTGLLKYVRALKFTPLRLMSVGLMFLLIFRTQSAYEKWLLARQCWANVTIACRDVCSNVATYNSDLDAVALIGRHLILFVVSLRCWLRHQPMTEKLLGGLATEGFWRSVQQVDDHQNGKDARTRVFQDPKLSFQFKNTCYPLMMLEVIRTTLDLSLENKTMAPFHGSVEQGMKALTLALCNMERVQDTELPFAYIVHIRTAVVVFFLVAPVFLINESGFFGLVFCLVFSYILFGLENLAEELSDPFGQDSNDLPADTYVCVIARDVFDTIQRRLKTRKNALNLRLASQEAEAALPGSAGLHERSGASPRPALPVV